MSQRNALCILAAGKGTRLGSIGQHLNKALLPVNNKALISDIIDKLPDCDIVIAVHYLEQQVRDYCAAAHPDRQFYFAHVDDITGPWSGPGKSLLACKEYLQRPFYLITADCLATGNLSPSTDNWIGVAKTDNPQIYATVKIEDSKVVDFKNKDKHGHKWAWIGISWIHDYDKFWISLDQITNGEVADVFGDINGFPTYARELKWKDFGLLDNYLLENIPSLGLIKKDEFTYKVHNRCIKLFSDKHIASGRMIRAKNLHGLIPEIVYKGEQLYAYTWEKGNTLYEINNLHLMKDFLQWCQNNLWKPSNADLTIDSMKFYQKKTNERVTNYLSQRDKSYLKAHTISCTFCEPILDVLKKVPWKNLCSEFLSTHRFHGDLQFDNVIFNSRDYVLLDWRQSFGDSYSHGDVYYDLAKMYGCTLISYYLLKDESTFDINYDGDNVSYHYTITRELTQFQKYFEEWVVVHYDLQRVKLIAALIWLNMSSLHTKKMGDLLFFAGREHLQKILS